MKILVLGDCASAGTNILTPEITGEKGALVEYSLAWNNKYWKAINVWYLKQTKNKREKITDWTKIPFDALYYLSQQEIANSYWKYINVPVVNKSKNGATAYGYYKRLIKYEKKEGVRPELIIVTDHTLNHCWQRINYLGQKYFFEKQYDKRKPIFSVNPILKSPVEAQKLAFEKSKKIYENNLRIKRNNKSMSWFLTFLKKNDYKFIKIKFYKGFSDFDNDPDVLDCSDLVERYSTPRGDRTDIKIAVAPLIAQRIIERYPSPFSSFGRATDL